MTDPRNPLERRLTALHRHLLELRDGEVEDGIPALADADPGLFGLALMTADGDACAAGDADAPFTVQSAAKPFVYALAIADAGREGVLRRVGTEPTGEAFDAVVLEAGTGRPPNPMVNAGAIMTATLVRGATADERFDRIRTGLSAFAGRSLEVDERVRASESAASDRNFALAHLMHGSGVLTVPVDEAVECYVRTGSLLVTARDLAVMGATLAAGGRNPLTGERVVAVELLTTVLSVMASCGLYDGAGTWTHRVGLPAKSGVAGGLVAVAPGQLGIGVFSPPLDANGNSVRGVRACERLSEDLGLHQYASTRSSVPVVQSQAPGLSRSRQQRPPAEAALLEQHADRIQVWQLQGPMTVLTAHALSRLLLAYEATTPSWLVLDLHRVGSIADPALALVHEVARALEAAGMTVRLVDRDRPEDIREAVTAYAGPLDEVLAACEQELLDRLSGPA